MENSKFLIQLNESQMTKCPVPNTKQGSIIVSSLPFREFFSLQSQSSKIAGGHGLYRNRDCTAQHLWLEINWFF